MTITLPLQPQEEARLIAAAQARGVSTSDLVREALNKLLADSLESERSARAEPRPIWEVMLGNVKDVSPEEFAQLPVDGASEHDQYLSGVCKTSTEEDARRKEAIERLRNFGKTHGLSLGGMTVLELRQEARP